MRFSPRVLYCVGDAVTNVQLVADFLVREFQGDASSATNVIVVLPFTCV